MSLVHSNWWMHLPRFSISVLLSVSVFRHWWLYGGKCSTHIAISFCICWVSAAAILILLAHLPSQAYVSQHFHHSGINMCNVLDGENNSRLYLCFVPFKKKPACHSSGKAIQLHPLYSTRRYVSPFPTNGFVLLKQDDRLKVARRSGKERKEESILQLLFHYWSRKTQGLMAALQIKH